MPRIIVLLALRLLSPPAAWGASAAASADHEIFSLIGWNNACSAAFSHQAYPRLGEAIQAEPVVTKIGMLTIPPGKESAHMELLADWNGRRSWRPKEAARLTDELRLKGYSAKGYRELLRPDPVVEERDLPRLLLSTDTFRTAFQDFPQDSRWRLVEVRYSPLQASCALFIYRDSRRAKDFFTFRLLRVGNPGIRYDRALAHVTNGLLLLERGDRAGALAETAIAAELAPDDAASRYEYGAMLALNGLAQRALDELEAAIKLNAVFKKKAREDINYEELTWMPRFKDLVER